LTCHLMGKPHGIRSPSDDTSQMLGDSSPFLISVSAPEFAVGRIYADAGDDRSVSRAIVVRACSTRRHAEPKSPRISDRLDRQVPARVVLDSKAASGERGLSAGGRWIRTLGPPAIASFVVGPRSLLRRAGGGEIDTAVQPDFFCSSSHCID